MANVQTYFNKFHNNIRRSYDDNSILREKRDLLLDDLREGLRRHAQNRNLRIPRFEHFNQGSYAIGTGIEPLPGEDYDIDVGLNFHLSKNDYSPIEVKKWVYEALHTGNRTVEYKRPCVRVQYHRSGEVLYHVDLAVYSESSSNWDNRTYLAKGFPGSGPENRIWEVAEPKKLIEIFQQKFQHQDGHREQFNRKLLNQVQATHGHRCKVFILPAVPVSIAVECGRVLLPTKDPKIFACEYYNQEGFRKVLKIN